MAPQEDVENGDDAQTQGRAGLAGTVEMIDGPEVPVMRDVPTRQTAPNHCLAKNPDAANRGATARTDAFDEPFVTAEADAVAASSADAPYVNLTRCFRNERTCPETVEKTAVLHDHHHLTQTFSRSMAETLWQQLEPTLA